MQYNKNTSVAYTFHLFFIFFGRLGLFFLIKLNLLEQTIIQYIKTSFNPIFNPIKLFWRSIRKTMAEFGDDHGNATKTYKMLCNF